MCLGEKNVRLMKNILVRNLRGKYPFFVIVNIANLKDEELSNHNLHNNDGDTISRSNESGKYNRMH